MKDENFYNVTGWMINRLKLSGSNLVCYAVIYGITQDGDTWFTGSLKYLQGWMSASQPTVLKALQYLTEKGYITKKDVIKNNVHLCWYKNNIDIEGTKKSLEGVVKFLNQGTKESLEGGSKETLDNNKYKDNKYNNKKENVIEKDPQVERFMVWMQKEYPHVCKMKKPLTLDEYNKLRDLGYSTDQITSKLDVLENRDDYIRRYRSPYLCVRNWLKSDFTKVKR